MNILEYSGPRPRRVRRHRFLQSMIVASASFIGLGIIVVEARAAPAFGGTALFVEGATFLSVTCVTALVLGLIVERSGVRFKVFLAALCLVPCILMPSITKYETRVDVARSMRLNFTELFECPVPSTLSEFSSVPDQITRDSVFHFRMSRQDMDSILSRNRFKIISATSRPINDLMFGSGPLSLGINDEVFILEEEGGDVRTVRLNASHTEGYFRSQHIIQTTTGPVDLNRG
jgi:hypothetical protein